MKRGFLLLGAAAAVAASLQRAPSEADRAAAAFKARFPRAVLESVRAPGPLDPAGNLGGERLYWIFRYRAGGRAAEVSMAPDGVIVRTVAPAVPGEIPAAVSKAIREAWPEADLDGVNRSEVRATLRFLAVPAPDQIYGLVLEKDGRSVHLDIRPDGSLKPRPAPLSGALDGLADSAFYPPPALKEQDAPVPAEARAAVEAVKKEYPGAVVQAVEPTIFNDRAGTLETVYFEVEIGTGGRARTVPVTPDGVLLYKTTRLAEADLPAAVSEAAARTCPGGIFKECVLQEVRAAARFVAIDAPRVVFTLEVAERGRKETALFKPDGTRLFPTRPWQWRGR